MSLFLSPWINWVDIFGTLCQCHFLLAVKVHTFGCQNQKEKSVKSQTLQNAMNSPTYRWLSGHILCCSWHQTSCQHPRHRWGSLQMSPGGGKPCWQPGLQVPVEESSCPHGEFHWKQIQKFIENARHFQTVYVEDSHLAHRVSNFWPEFINYLIQLEQGKLFQQDVGLIQQCNHSNCRKIKCSHKNNN